MCFLDINSLPAFCRRIYFLLPILILHVMFLFSISYLFSFLLLPLLLFSVSHLAIAITCCCGRCHLAFLAVSIFNPIGSLTSRRLLTHAFSWFPLLFFHIYFSNFHIIHRSRSHWCHRSISFDFVGLWEIYK
jgi:integral membrane sensor domain MASE1